MCVLAYAPWGAEGIIIRVETDIRRGIPGIDITGLAQGAVREARERIRVSFRNSGFDFPHDRVLINLAPAGVRKEGASLDLPIAVSVMAAAGIVPVPDDIMVLGELELSGRLRPVRGALAAIAAGLKAGIQEFIIPLENLNEAAVLKRGTAANGFGVDSQRGTSVSGLDAGVQGLRFFAAATLGEVVHSLHVRAETGELPRIDFAAPFSSGGEAGRSSWAGDFSEVKGQVAYKRVLEIAAAGGHNLLVFGPPGSGKTMLARRFSSILPPLAPNEAVEVTRLHSLAGQITNPYSADGLVKEPPFRSPHHSASVEGILGGGRNVRPGEITLAHFGTLFLDEAPEFRKPVLQSLREPLEDRVVTIVRAEGPLRLPADFQLILAANGCPCGRLGAPSGMPAGDGSGCFCASDDINRYWRKLGGSLLDRIDLRIPVRSPGVLTPNGDGGEKSELIMTRVAEAVKIQRERFKDTENSEFPTRRNSNMSPGQINKFCVLAKRAEEVFVLAAARLSLSGRACHSILKVARTIADLEKSELIETNHVLEAIQYRRFGDDPYDILAQP